MFSRGYHGISIVLSVLALLLCPLFHPCTGERNVFIWVSENCSYTYTSTRIYAAYIYIYIHMRILYIYIYIYTPHRCILFMYVFCIFVVPAAQKSSAIFMYVLCTFLVGHGCENGVFLPQIQAFSKGIYGNHFGVKPLHFGVFPYFSDTTSSLLVWSRCLVCVCAPRSLEPILWHLFKSVSPAHSAAHSGSFYITMVFFIRETVHAPNGRKSSRAFPDQRSLGL
jgi:hypothetical protein